MNKKNLWMLLVVLTLIFVLVFVLKSRENNPADEEVEVSNGADSVPSLEISDQITAPGSKDDLIQLDEPKPGSEVASPIKFSGKARGYWFFEGSFPVEVVDSSGLIIGQTVATAEGEWMTEDFVPFSGEIEYEPVIGIESTQGKLIFRKDNPSGLKEHDDALVLSIVFN